MRTPISTVKDAGEVHRKRDLANVGAVRIGRVDTLAVLLV